MPRERDEDAERNPETRGRIDKRRKKKSEISRGYREARQELPDNPRDDPWGYTELPTRNPAENIVPPLWERIRSNALTVSQSSKQSNDLPAFLLAKALGKIQFFPHYWHPGVNENLTQNLDGNEHPPRRGDWRGPERREASHRW
ncbi:MAG: hypothetical protein A07HR60_02827 [uncultured archaeon A07HR60]|jgi:hypothetical protein|nr:MAG: hypothetical protein A07HR60_02827 [uncultured archaeon A07HR60]